MKIQSLKSWAKYSVLTLGMAVVFGACSKSDDDTPTPSGPKVEDGYYVKGAATAFSDLSSDAIMANANNEVDQTVRGTLYEEYIAVKAGSEGFNIIIVEGSKQTVLGPGEGFGEVIVADRDVDEPKDGSLQKGAISETDAKFTVAADGLYHVMYDSQLKVGAVVEVKWGLIGAATPNGWNGNTELATKEFGTSKVVFESENIALSKSDWKFRYSNGWKIVLDTTEVIAEGKKGVKVNSNLGGAIDALAAGGDNITNDVAGYYTINLTWEVGKGTQATLTKTGDFRVDWTDIELGLIGNVYQTATGAQANWDSNYPGLTQKPTKEGYVYTWEFNGITLTAGEAADFAGQFKFRQGDDWDGTSFGYKGNTINGTGADLLDPESNGDGNFVFKDLTYVGTYNIKVVIDADADTKTITIDIL